MRYANLKRLLFVALLVVVIIGSNSTIIASSKTNSLEEVFIDDICFLQNTDLDEEQFVKKYVERLFYVKRSYIKDEITDEFIHYVFGDFQNNKSVRGFINKMTFEREWLKCRESVILWDCVSIEFFDIIFDNNKINVNLLEKYTYIQDNYNYGISSEGTRYSIEIKKIEDKWLVTNVESHDLLDTIFMDEFNLEETLNWMKNEEPNQSNDNIEKYKKVKEFEEKINTEEDFSILVDKTFTSYDKVRAKEYIDEYDGTERNSNFFDYSSDGGDCQNFASQCLWYGFGGLNTKSAIDNKLFPMIRNNGSRDWYQTSIKYDTPETWAWTGVDEFFEYIENGSGTAFGPTGVIYDDVAYAEVGDIIQIETSGDDEFDHSFVVYRVQGTVGSRTKYDIWVSSHTSDLENELLAKRATKPEYILRTIHIMGHWSPAL